MEGDVLPEDTAKQWEVLLCIIAFEEKKIDRRTDGNLETLTYFWNHRGVRHIFTEWLHQMKLSYDKKTAEDESSQKSEEISLLWRQRGNVKFKAEAYEESIKLYTKSIIYANKAGPLYAIALANRSAASLRLRRFKDSLKDVQRALNKHYPLELQHKLYLRRADCYAEMGQRQKALDAVDHAMRHLAKMNLKGQAKAEFDRSYKQVQGKLAVLKYDIPQEEPRLPQLFLGENPDFKYASAAIELKRNDTVGRYVVTKDATKRGDVLFSEEAFAGVKLHNLDADDPTFCDFCCNSEPANIPCNDCTAAVFCDEACHHLGREMYHRWECAAMRANIFSVIGIAHLALRVMFKYAHRGFPRLPDSFGTPTTAARLIECYSQVDRVEIYKNEFDSFYRMFCLTSNMETSANTDNIQYALTVTMLVLYLEKYTSFFEYFPKRVGYPLPMNEMKLFCAALMFRTLGQLVINAHTVLEVNTGQLPDISFLHKTEPFRRVGTAIYPSVSMMNHSCEPNITNLFYKNHLFVKGIRELPQGAEVFNCYGPHHARDTLAERREKLRTQYGFTCFCDACTDETRKDFTLLFSAYACPSCKGPVTWEGTKMSCHQCPNEFPLLKAQNSAETADSMHALVTCKRCHTELKKGTIFMNLDRGLIHIITAMRAPTAQERCERMVRAYRLMQQVLYRHHNVLRKTADDLAMMYAAVGDYAKSIDLIKQNVQSFEYQFGSFSVEVTNEIRKMANMMLGRIIRYFDNPELDEGQPMHIRDWIRETLKIVRKANQLMELNYGTWLPMYKTFKDKEEILENMVIAPRIHDHTDCFNYRLQNLHF